MKKLFTNKTRRIGDIEIEAGRTTEDNLQMHCKEDNRRKSGK
jgi:hypothetical protein